MHKLLTNVKEGRIIGVQAVLADGTKSPVFGEGNCTNETLIPGLRTISEVSIKKSPDLDIQAIKLLVYESEYG